MVGDSATQNETTNTNARSTTSDNSQAIGLEGSIGSEPIVSRFNRRDFLVCVKSDGAHILEPDTDSARGARSTSKGSMTATASSKLATSQAGKQNCSTDFRVLGRTENAMRLHLFLLHRPERASEVVVPSGLLSRDFGAKKEAQTCTLRDI